MNNTIALTCSHPVTFLQKYAIYEFFLSKNNENDNEPHL